MYISLNKLLCIKYAIHLPLSDDFQKKSSEPLVSTTLQNDRMAAFVKFEEYFYYVCILLQENVMLELCLAKFWSNLGQADIQYSIRFYGVSLCQSPVVIVSIK